MKLGYKASAEQFGPAELLRFGVRAEELGFDSVFVSDHANLALSSLPDAAPLRMAAVGAA